MSNEQTSLLPTLIAEQLEQVANRALHYAPLTRLQLRKLEGKSFGIELQRPPLSLLVSVTRKGLLFQSHWDGNADAGVRGPALALLKQLRRGNNQPELLASDGIDLTGDPVLAQQFIKVLNVLDIDFEGILGDLIGDVAAHQLSEFARTGFSWLNRTGKNLLQQSRHFLAEERKVLLTPHQFSRFRDDVETLSEDTDRAEARLHRLFQQLDSRPRPEDVKP